MRLNTRQSSTPPRIIMEQKKMIHYIPLYSIALKQVFRNMRKYFKSEIPDIFMFELCMLLFSFLDDSVQFSSVAQSCPTLGDPMNCSTPGIPVYHQLPEFTQTHIHRVSDAIQPTHPLSSPSPAPNPSQHQSLFQEYTSHEVAKELEFQLQHQSFQ